MIVSRIHNRTTASPTRHVLLDGTSTPADAREAALALLDAALDLHKLRNFRSQIRSERPDPDAQRAIASLSEARAELLELFARAEAEGLRIRVNTVLEVEAVEPRR